MKVFDGQKAAAEILNKVKALSAAWPKKPRLAVVSVGKAAGNSSFIRQKSKAANLLNFGFRHYHFDLPLTSAKFRRELDKIARAKANSALVVQLPLPENIDPAALDVIPVDKDVDLLSARAVGMFYNGRALVPPPTAAAILKILADSKRALYGRRVAVFGAGRLVGRFLVPLLLARGAAVSIIEKYTSASLAKKIARQADIIVSAVGQPNLITAAMVKKGAVVIDAGFSELDGKVVGDVDFEAVRARAFFITPVPGGVGPVAVAVLMANVAELYSLENQSAKIKNQNF